MVDGDIYVEKIQAESKKFKDVNDVNVDLKGHTKVIESDTEKGKEISKPPTQITTKLFLFQYKVKKKVEDGKFNKFLSMLKQLLVNILLVETLKKMLGYAKFIKDLVTKKRTESFQPMDNRQYCIATALQSLVQKKNDLGAFTSLCTIGAFNF